MWNNSSHRFIFSDNESVYCMFSAKPLEGGQTVETVMMHRPSKMFGWAWRFPVLHMMSLFILSLPSGFTRFDLLGDFGRFNWLGNFYIVILYNMLFAGLTTLCLVKKFTWAVQAELIRAFGRCPCLFFCQLSCSNLIFRLYWWRAGLIYNEGGIPGELVISRAICLNPWGLWGVCASMMDPSHLELPAHNLANLPASNSPLGWRSFPACVPSLTTLLVELFVWGARWEAFEWSLNQISPAFSPHSHPRPPQAASTSDTVSPAQQAQLDHVFGAWIKPDKGNFAYDLLLGHPDLDVKTVLCSEPSCCSRGQRACDQRLNSTEEWSFWRLGSSLLLPLPQRAWGGDGAQITMNTLLFSSWDPPVLSAEWRSTLGSALRQEN